MSTGSCRFFALRLDLAINGLAPFGAVIAKLCRKSKKMSESACLVFYNELFGFPSINLSIWILREIIHLAVVGLGFFPDNREWLKMSTV